MDRILAFGQRADERATRFVDDGVLLRLLLGTEETVSPELLHHDRRDHERHDADERRIERSRS